MAYAAWFTQVALLNFFSSSYPDAEMASPTDEVDTATDDSATDTGLDHGWQLQLPSGATIGHRALRRYYRQKLRPPPMTLVAASSNSAAGVEQRRTLVQKLMNEYRHLQISQVTSKHFDFIDYISLS